MSAIRVGMQYNSSQPTVGNGQITEFQCDANGNLKTTAGATGATADQIQGNVAAAATDAGNPVKIGAVNNTTLPTYTNGQRGDLQISTRGVLLTNITSPSGVAVTVTTSGDATSNGTTVLYTGSFSNTFNGSTWDRTRSVTNSTDSVGTGIQAAGLVAQLDDTAPSTVTENQFGNLRMTPARALLVEEGPFTATRVTGDTQIKASAGFVHTVSIAPTTATPTAGLLTVYDNTAESGTAIFSEWVFATTAGHTIILDARCATGIFVGYDATLANVSCTVTFR